MDYLEAVKVLKCIPLFSSLDGAKLKLLAFVSEYQSYEDGEALFHEGEPSDSVYLIDEGEAKVTVNADGKIIEVATLKKNDLIGEMGIFRNLARSATLRASGNLKVLRMEGDMFLKMVTEDAAAALGVMRALSDKVALASAPQASKNSGGGEAKDDK